MYISRKKHEAIVADLLKKINLFDQYESMRKDNQKNNDSLVKILDKLVDKSNFLCDASISCLDGTDVMAYLDDTVPVYVEDILGGKVIKQEATSVTKLDKKGKATYGYTKVGPSKDKEYLLIQD